METKKTKKTDAEEEALNLLAQKQAELSKIATSDLSARVKIVLQNHPIKSEDPNTLDKFAILFQQILLTAKDKENSIVENLNEIEATNLYDFINKSFEMISKGKCKEDKFLPNKLFKLHELLVKHFGQAVILRAICRQRSLVSQIDNFPLFKDPNLL